MARGEEAPRKVHGPKIPGAKERPTVKKMGPIKNRRSPKPKLAKDPVEKADRKTQQYMALNPNSARARKILKIERLKELIEPIDASLVQVMSDIAHDKKVHPAVRLDAADRLLTRLYGKPTEHVQLHDPDEDSIDADEVTVLLNRILESVGAPLLDTPDDDEPTGDDNERGKQQAADGASGAHAAGSGPEGSEPGDERASAVRAGPGLTDQRGEG